VQGAWALQGCGPPHHQVLRDTQATLASACLQRCISSVRGHATQVIDYPTMPPLQVDVVSELVTPPSPPGTSGPVLDPGGGRQGGQEGGASKKGKAGPSLEPPAEGSAGSAGVTPRPATPSIQDLTGRWSGHIQLFGTPVGATNVEFGLLGEDWR
jgi:hypothetical protein